MPRLPVACNIETRDGTLSKDSKLVNCLVDMEGQNAFVVKRPGMIKRVAAAAGAALGAISWEGKMFHATGSTIYQTDYASIPSGSGGGAQPSTIDIVGSGNFGLNANDGVTFINGTTIVTACVNNSDGYTQWVGSSNGGITWSQLSIDYLSDFARCSISYVNGVLVRFTGDGGYLNSSQIHTSSNNGGSWSLIGSTISDSILSYPINTTFSEGGLMYFFIHNPHGTGDVGDNTLDLCSTNGSTASVVATIPGITVANTGVCKLRGFLKLGGVYYFYLYCVIGTPISRVYRSTDKVNWTYVDLPVFAGASSYSLITDGTSLALFDGSTLKKLDVLTFAIISTETLSVPASSFALITNPVLVGDMAVVNYIDDYNGIVYCAKIKIASGATSYAAPPYSYPFTTVTPGLPLSWVGTSPGTATKRMFIKNTEKAWTFTPGAPGTLTQVTDPDYPAVTVPGVAYLDGFFFVMDKDGTIYNCDLENPTSWNSLNYISAESEWDAGVAVAKHQNYVVALKDWTTELFYNAANATGSPLQRLANAALQIGCANGYSVVQFHGGLIFMSKTREKGRSVHFFPSDSAAPVEIASPAVQRVLNKADLTKVRSWGGKLGGRTMYVLSLATADVTLVYDFTTKLWALFTSDNGAGLEGYFKYGFYATDGSRDYLLHESNGNVYEFSPETYQDDGINIDVLIRTGRTDSGNLDRKSMPTLEVVGDKQTTNVTISVSDDDYQTFSALDPVSLDDDPPRLRRLGAYVRRSFDIRHVDNTPLRLLALDAEIKQMR